MTLSEGQVQLRSLVFGAGTSYRFASKQHFNPFARTVRAEQGGLRAWRDGAWSGAEFADAATIPMRLVMLADGTGSAGHLALIRALSAAFAPSSDDLELRFVLAGSEYVMFGRPRLVEPDSRMIDGTGYVSTAFVALDPLIYSGAESSSVISPPAFAGGAAADGVQATTPPFGLVVNGSSGNYASTPDNAVLDIVGDVDLRADVTLSNWATGSVQYVISKYLTTGNQRSYALRVGTAGELQLVTSADGINPITATATTNPTPAASGRLALRATLDVNNGAGGRTTTFYTAPTINGPWVQLGNPVVVAATTSIFSGTAALISPGIDGGTISLATGTIHATEVRDGIDGTVVASGDFAAQPNATTTFVDYSGRTWTVQGAATINGQRIGGGLLVPFWVEAVQTGGIASLTNSGTADTAVNLRIDGPISQPTVSLIRPDGTTQQLRFLFNLLSGEFVVVDSKARTVFAQGLDTASRRGQVTGEFPILPPGTSTLQLTAADAQSGTVTATWRSAWW